MQKIKDFLSKLNVVIVSHVFETGPPQELEDFLMDKVNSLAFIGHPFSYSKEINSFLKVHEKGKLISKTAAPAIKGKESLLYLKDFLFTILFVLKQKKRYDVYIGVDCLNALTGLFLRRLSVVRAVIFYTIDYVPTRFKNPILNSIYHWMDKICVKYCDFVWNLSPAMAEERGKRGILKKDSAPQIVVPVGANLRRIQCLPLELINRNRLAYVGRLEELFGVQLVLKALQDVVKQVPDVELIIIGDGPFRKILEEIAQERGLEKNVKFLGFIEKHSEVEQVLTKCSIGLATYVPEPNSYKMFTDVTKPKLYLACGLPVIITRVPPIADKIDKNRAGIAINYERKELVEVMIRLLTDNNLYREYRKNAIQFASMYDWEIIFSNALLPIREKFCNSARLESDLQIAQEQWNREYQKYYDLKTIDLSNDPELKDIYNHVKRYMKLKDGFF